MQYGRRIGTIVVCNHCGSSIAINPLAVANEAIGNPYRVAVTANVWTDF